MQHTSVQPKQTPADGLPLASGLPGLLLDSSWGTLTAQREERRSPPVLPPAIRPEADGNTQTASTRGAKRQRGKRTRERPIESKRESNRCLGVVFATQIETDNYRNKAVQRRKTRQISNRLTSTCHLNFCFQRIKGKRTWPLGCEVFFHKAREKNKRDLRTVTQQL